MLDDPLALTRTFIAQDGSFQNYDLADVPRDASLSESDVRVANRIIARMGQDTVAAILSRTRRASRALERIPPRASLVDDDAAIPWGPLSDLFRAFEDLPGVGLPRLTKVLHKKRPALVPILDSVVDRYLVAWTSTCGPIPVSTTRSGGASPLRLLPGQQHRLRRSPQEQLPPTRSRSSVTRRSSTSRGSPVTLRDGS